MSSEFDSYLQATNAYLAQVDREQHELDGSFVRERESSTESKMNEFISDSSDHDYHLESPPSPNSKEDVQSELSSTPQATAGNGAHRMENRLNDVSHTVIGGFCLRGSVVHLRGLQPVEAETDTVRLKLRQLISPHAQPMENQCDAVFVSVSVVSKDNRHHKTDETFTAKMIYTSGAESVSGSHLDSVDWKMVQQFCHWIALEELPRLSASGRNGIDTCAYLQVDVFGMFHETTQLMGTTWLPIEHLLQQYGDLYDDWLLVWPPGTLCKRAIRKSKRLLLSYGSAASVVNSCTELVAALHIVLDLRPVTENGDLLRIGTDGTLDYIGHHYTAVLDLTQITSHENDSAFSKSVSFNNDNLSQMDPALDRLQRSREASPAVEVTGNNIKQKNVFKRGSKLYLPHQQQKNNDAYIRAARIYDSTQVEKQSPAHPQNYANQFENDNSTILQLPSPEPAHNQSLHARLSKLAPVPEENIEDDDVTRYRKRLQRYVMDLRTEVAGLRSANKRANTFFQRAHSSLSKMHTLAEHLRNRQMRNANQRSIVDKDALHNRMKLIENGSPFDVLELYKNRIAERVAARNQNQISESVQLPNGQVHQEGFDVADVMLQTSAAVAGATGNLGVGLEIPARAMKHTGRSVPHDCPSPPRNLSKRYSQCLNVAEDSPGNKLTYNSQRPTALQVRRQRFNSLRTRATQLHEKLRTMLLNKADTSYQLFNMEKNIMRQLGSWLHFAQQFQRAMGRVYWEMIKQGTSSSHLYETMKAFADEFGILLPVTQTEIMSVLPNFVPKTQDNAGPLRRVRIKPQPHMNPSRDTPMGPDTRITKTPFGAYADNTAILTGLNTYRIKSIAPNEQIRDLDATRPGPMDLDNINVEKQVSPSDFPTGLVNHLNLNHPSLVRMSLGGITVAEHQHLDNLQAKSDFARREIRALEGRIAAVQRRLERKLHRTFDEICEINNKISTKQESLERLDKTLQAVENERQRMLQQYGNALTMDSNQTDVASLSFTDIRNAYQQEIAKLKSVAKDRNTSRFISGITQDDSNLASH